MKFPGLPRLAVCVLLLPLTLHAAENPKMAAALETIDREDLYAYISYLASDRLYGRNAGTRGNERAVEWIADFFRRAGLKPGGDDGTFLQSFAFRPRGAGKTRLTASNVVALWEGADPGLREECVVVGAHMDHVGKEGHETNPGRIGRATCEDGIWNGADDNASGTAAVLEIAQAFSSMRIETKRTVVFVLFNAEEHGLHGSWHYVKHPTFPLDRTLAMVNLDMIGRNSKRAVNVFGADSAEDDYFKRLVNRCLEDVSELKLHFSGSVFGGSDHWPFIKQKVPALFFFSGLHTDYHQTGDHVEKIDCHQVQQVARLSFLMLHEMADMKGGVSFASALEHGFRGLGIDLGKGIADHELRGFGLSESQGAVRIAKVYPGTPAERAGLEEGDLILKIGEVRFRVREPVTSLKEAIAAAPVDEDVEVEVVRGSRRLTLTMTLPADD